VYFSTRRKWSVGFAAPGTEFRSITVRTYNWTKLNRPFLFSAQWNGTVDGLQVEEREIKFRSELCFAVPISAEIVSILFP
jgi:hypothetical protein